MSSIATLPTPHRPTTTGRRSITTKASFSDDEITPCSSPAPEPQEPIFHPAEPVHKASPPRFTPLLSRRGSNSAASSSSPKTSTTVQPWHFDPTDGEDMDDSRLWQRMLDIQRTFHCYNSARMSAALLELELGVDVGRLAPSRSCLDLMNDSISDMTGEERQKLMDWLHENSKRKRSGIWRRSFVF